MRSPESHKTVKASIGTSIKNLEMQKFVPDHLNIEKMCKKAVKKLPFVIMYVPDQYTAQEMCNNVILENSRILRFIPNCYKSKKNV